MEFGVFLFLFDVSLSKIFRKTAMAFQTKHNARTAQVTFGKSIEHDQSIVYLSYIDKSVRGTCKAIDCVDWKELIIK